MPQNAAQIEVRLSPDPNHVNLWQYSTEESRRLAAEWHLGDDERGPLEAVRPSPWIDLLDADDEASARKLAAEEQRSA